MTNFATTLIVLSVITLGLMTQGNDYATFTIGGDNLTIVSHEEFNGSVVDKVIDQPDYWLYTDGNITTKQYDDYFEVTKS
jgi:hypothetical protein